MSNPWTDNSNDQQYPQKVRNFSRPHTPKPQQEQPTGNNQQQGQQYLPGPIGIAMTTDTRHPGQQSTTSVHQSGWQQPQDSAAGYHGGWSQSQYDHEAYPPDRPSRGSINQTAQDLPQGSQAQPHTNPQNTGQQRWGQAEPQYGQLLQKTYQGQGRGSQGQPRGDPAQAFINQNYPDPNLEFLRNQGRSAQNRRTNNW